LGDFHTSLANPNARVLASKSAFKAALGAVLEGKSVADAVALTQAIHDASIHLSANYVAREDVSEDGDDGADDGPKNPSFAAKAQGPRALTQRRPPVSLMSPGEHAARVLSVSGAVQTGR
jgi:hypothetical protein